MVTVYRHAASACITSRYGPVGYGEFNRPYGKTRYYMNIILLLDKIKEENKQKKTNMDKKQKRTGYKTVL